MKKLSLTIVTVLLVAAMATFAFGYGWGRDGGGRGRGPGNGPCMGEGISAASGLNLTADQEANIRSLRDAQMNNIKPLQEAMFSKRKDLRLLWQQENPDQEKITAIQREIRSLRDQVQDKATENRLAFFKILTPEQQSKLQIYGGNGAGRGAGQCAGAGPDCGARHGFGPRGKW